MIINLRYAVNGSKWNAMNDLWKEKQYTNFLNDAMGIGKAEKKIKIKRTPGIAKKPGQRRRAKSERTIN